MTNKQIRLAEDCRRAFCRSYRGFGSPRQNDTVARAILDIAFALKRANVRGNSLQFTK